MAAPGCGQVATRARGAHVWCVVELTVAHASKNVHTETVALPLSPGVHVPQDWEQDAAECVPGELGATGVLADAVAGRERDGVRHGLEDNRLCGVGAACRRLA